MKARNTYLLKEYKRAIKRLFFLSIFLLCGYGLFAQKIISLTNKSIPLSIGKSSEILVDSKGIYDSSNIIAQNDFQSSEKSVLVFSVPVKSLWIRFNVEDLSNQKELYFSLKYSNIGEISFYEKDQDNHLKLLKRTGNNYKFYSRGNGNVDFNFPLTTTYGQKKTYYVNIRSDHPLELPLTINNYSSLNENNSNQNLIIGIYCGIILSTFLYNFFVSFATKDKSYFVYIIYLFSLGLAQLTFAGWSFKYFWPSIPSINSYIVICTTCFAGIMGITFAKSFLHTDRYALKINMLLNFLIAVYIVAILLAFSKFSFISYLLINYNSLAGGITLLVLSIIIFKKGYRPAYFYLLAWSSFLAAVIIYTLKNLGFLPTNNFTHYILYFGSSIEAILLSFALADKINTYKKEKEISQAEALKVSLENEILIKEQNVILEQKVNERTNELQSANSQLNKTLEELKDAQTQLVEAEKMASLGQLTAGIAHEINNPINFVKSNIKPLNLDIDDVFEVIDMYNTLHMTKETPKISQQLNKISEKQEEIDLPFVKQEIKQLIKGIEDGAERTAEIVRGLRTFSRLDESELKVANVHDGLNSTLILLRNNMPPYFRIERKFLAKGDIECFPGKLNQVFMNILNNAIQAIEEKKQKEAEEWILISTLDIGDKMQVRIKDTGIGMTEEVKHKIFEPFFTTKSVGVGTGLGMAIVFKIIEEHFGKIEVESEPGKGAEFILTLPHIHPVT